MAPVPGPMVNLDTVTALKSVKESILVSTAPFGPQRHMLSPHGPLPLHIANARGVATVTRMFTYPANNANSVQLSCSVSVSHSLFLVPVTVVVSSARFTSKQPAPGTPCSNPPFQYVLGCKNLSKFGPSI